MRARYPAAVGTERELGAMLMLRRLGFVAGAAALEESTIDLTQVVGQVFAVAVHLMLMSVLTVGLAAIVRSSAGTITVLFVLLLLAAWTAASLTLATVILGRRDA
ncbi:hypothetical protein [Streptomyces sp. NPDC057302]|uniref:hypothetical protein n=1 Tax=Streptomyces sp. NPDC057302 TaxID=3346094 RepID=UPI00362CEDD9